MYVMYEQACTVPISSWNNLVRQTKFLVAMRKEYQDWLVGKVRIGWPLNVGFLNVRAPFLAPDSCKASFPLSVDLNWLDESSSCSTSFTWNTTNCQNVTVTNYSAMHDSCDTYIPHPHTINQPTNLDRCLYGPSCVTTALESLVLPQQHLTIHLQFANALALNEHKQRRWEDMRNQGWSQLWLSGWAKGLKERLWRRTGHSLTRGPEVYIYSSEHSTVKIILDT